MSLMCSLDPNDVAIFDTFVIPRYMSIFGLLAVEMMAPCEKAIVANVGCRTGFPDHGIGQLLPASTVVGFDGCPAALELARTKSALIRDVTFDYRHEVDLPVNVDDQSFSHALCVYPMIASSQYPDLLRELFRLLVEGGQALLATPLRGSFQEIADLLREYALKHDATHVANALEASAGTRLTVEDIADAFEQAGFEEVDVEMRITTLTFRSGRDFFEDPVTRLMIVPDVELSLGIGDLASPFAYLREAIDRYWSEGDFELGVNVGCVSARRP